jgi:hypothetical protein
LENRCYRLFQARMSIGNDEVNTTQATGFQTSQERGPKRAILAVTNVHPEDFTAAIRADTDSDDDGLGHDPVIHTRLAIRGIKEHVRVFHFS